MALFKETFSFSKLSCFSKCPRKFFYRYVCGKKETFAHQAYGRAVHSGLEWDNREKIEGRKPPLKEVLDKAVEVLERENSENEAQVPKDAFVEEHSLQLEAYDKKHRDGVRPLPGSVEAMFAIKVKVGDPETGEPEADATIEGFVDCVSLDANGKKSVVDYKTAAKPVYAADAAKSLQFRLYEVGAQADGSRAISFVKGGKQRPTCHGTVPVPPTEAEQTKLWTWIADSIRGIRRLFVTGDAPKCEPSCWWCSKSACDFYNLCYPEKDPGLSKLIQVETINPVGTLKSPEWRK